MTSLLFLFLEMGGGWTNLKKVHNFVSDTWNQALTQHLVAKELKEAPEVIFFQRKKQILNFERVKAPA